MDREHPAQRLRDQVTLVVDRDDDRDVEAHVVGSGARPFTLRRSKSFTNEKSGSSGTRGCYPPHSREPLEIGQGIPYGIYLEADTFRLVTRLGPSSTGAR